jgi:ERCC4-type nuclease
VTGQRRPPVFVVGRNPQDDSKLPFLLRLPIERGLILKARERWPTTARIPRRRTVTEPVTITVDTRERDPFRFSRHRVETIRASVPAGDYAIHSADGSILATVERKSLENLAATLSDGTLAFQMQRLAELPLAAVVIEARYSALFKLEHVNGNWLADQLARLEVRYPEVHVVYADTRGHAEDWTHRFLTTALTDNMEPNPQSD